MDIARQVVDGIWQYGNAIGVPNLGGDVYFHPSFNENCLVNVVAVGIVEHDHITHSAVPPEAARRTLRPDPGGQAHRLVAAWAGAAFASATLDAEAATENKGSVQTPDPFLKRILSWPTARCWRWPAREGVTIGFKDLGAGGVSCVTSELADAGGFGCDVDLQLVHQIADLPARVCACSETQERYGLAVPARLTEKVLKIYNEDFALPSLYDGACACRIGVVTTERRYVLRWGDRILCRRARRDHHRGHPLRPAGRGARSGRRSGRTNACPKRPVDDIADEWLALLAHPNVASREYIYRHYDTEVQANTILRPGEADAGVVAPVPGSRRAVALSADGNPLLGLADPWTAGAAAVLEACRNVACVGGEPAAVTDCLNFGNPEVPESFWQFTEAVRGVGDACRGVGCYARPGAPLPVISRQRQLLQPEQHGPVGGAVAHRGLRGAWSTTTPTAAASASRTPGDLILLVGARRPETGGIASTWTPASRPGGRRCRPSISTRPAREIRAVIDLVRAGLVTAAHDISDGGLAVCLSEMAMGLEGAARLRRRDCGCPRPGRI